MKKMETIVLGGSPPNPGKNLILSFQKIINCLLRQVTLLVGGHITVMSLRICFISALGHLLIKKLHCLLQEGELGSDQSAPN